ncbi:hypothetical protein Tco_0435465 [Tanacetum coccineum]
MLQRNKNQQEDDGKIADSDYEHEKEELRMWLTVVSDEEETHASRDTHQGNAAKDIELEAEVESIMAFELLKFIKSH